MDFRLSRGEDRALVANLADMIPKSIQNAPPWGFLGRSGRRPRTNSVSRGLQSRMGSLFAPLARFWAFGRRGIFKGVPKQNLRDLGRHFGRRGVFKGAPKQKLRQEF